MYIEGVIAIACFEMVFHGMPTMITINAQSSLSLPYAFVFAFLLIARMWAGTFVRSK
jgi:hypothetical protein